MWGADYPHHEGLFPHTRLGLRALFSGVPEREVRQMTSLNAAALYGFDLDHLQRIADEIGPTVEELAHAGVAPRSSRRRRCRSPWPRAKYRLAAVDSART